MPEDNIVEGTGGSLDEASKDALNAAQAKKGGGDPIVEIAVTEWGCKGGGITGIMTFWVKARLR